MYRYGRSCAIFCYCLLTLFLVGCAPGAFASAPQAASSAPSVSLRGVDWANFTYFSSCYGNTQPFRARQGRARNGPISFEVFAPTFGNLGGDARSAAALPYECFAADSGGVRVFVYSGNAALPRLLGELPLPQAGGPAPLFNSLTVRISDEQIELSGASYSPSAPHCCPDLMLSLWYRWTGSYFVELRSRKVPLG